MSATATAVKLGGREYVILLREQYDRLAELPPLPESDEDGNYPAVEYARASLARNIIRDRVSAGLNQKELARLAGIRAETLCRIETGKHTPSVPTINKIDRALKRAAARKRKSRRAGMRQPRMDANKR